jgi:hypothetical protein
MLSWLVLGLLSGAGVTWWTVRAKRRRETVSPRWLITNRAREWQAGHDGPRWSWPVRHD